MSAGELELLAEQQQKQRPRRQSARRSSTPSSSLDITASAAADDSAKDAAGVARRSRSKQQQQQQQDTQDQDATALVAKPPRSSKRQKANTGNVSAKDDVHIVTDTFDNDTGAAEDGSAAASRRSTPAAAAAAAEEDPAAAASGGSSDSATGLTAFEAQRAARIAQNMARLAALELPEMAAGLAAAAAAAVKPKAAAAPTQRGISTKRKRSDQQQQPQRQSARTRGQAPDPTTAAGIDHEGRDGKVILAAAAAWNPPAAAAGSGDPAAAAAAAPPPPPGPLPFKSANGDESSDAHFLALLQRMQCTSTAAAAAGSSDGDESSAAATRMRGHDLSRLSLSSVDVAKMTKDGVSCLAFHPASDKLIIAAADKQGKVSLWDIDHHQQQQQQQSEDNPNGSSSSSDYDGVLMFTPHLDYVSSLKWLMGGSKLMTGSYDGTGRLLDVTSGVWDLVQGYCPDAAADGWSAGDAAANGYVIYTATSAGHMTVIDTRCDNGSSSSSSSWVIANRKVNTLHLHSNQNHLASSASDGSVAVWDVRKLAPAAAPAVGSSSSSYNPKSAKPLYQLSHTKSSQAAYWNPDGSNQLLSISFDDTLRIWGDDTAAGGNMTQKVLIRHNNNTGRWVVPFRPAWSPFGDAVLVGDLKRGVAVFDSSSGRQLNLLQSDALTAIPSRLAMHPSTGVKAMAAATSSGRVHIWR